MTLFNLLPLGLELIFVQIVIATLYPIVFFFITLASIVLYVGATVGITEWRAKHFKRMATKDTEYNQKATDSLLNFETVKYFNAEDHEEKRFMKALEEYKHENVIVARGLSLLNIA
jgi:ATP-binding cassette subfamily B protein